MTALNHSEFAQKFMAGNDAATAYIMASPTWVQVWIGIMMLVLLPSFILAFKHSEARWVAWSLVILAIWTPILMMATGPSRLWGITHLCFWTPVMFVALSSVLKYGMTDWYQKWLAAVAGVMAVSIVFDILDVIRFFSGEV